MVCTRSVHLVLIDFVFKMQIFVRKMRFSFSFEVRDWANFRVGSDKKLGDL